MIPTTYGAGLADRVRAVATEGVDLAFDTPAGAALPALVEITGDPQRSSRLPASSAADSAWHLTSGGGAWDALQCGAPVREGAVHPPGGSGLPLDQAGEAHRVSEGGHVRGKLVLVPA